MEIIEIIYMFVESLWAVQVNDIDLLSMFSVVTESVGQKVVR